MKRLACLALLTACDLYIGHDAPPADSGFPEVALVRANANRDLDLMLVVDDSSGMVDWQTNLAANFPAFIDEMNQLPGGMPNLHIGVVTSDVGTSAADDASPGPAIGSGPGSCSGLGKDGALQVGSAPLTGGKFIVAADNTHNFTGTLADAVAKLVAVGAIGCGIEQHLEAAKRALDKNPANGGFLRPDAGLAVVVLANEDDCSLSHSTMLSPSISELGPLASFRCTRFGVTCDQGGATPDAMNQIGPKGECHANTSSPFVADVARYKSFFSGLKADPDDVMVATIIGDPQPVNVELRPLPGGGSPVPALAHSCTYNGDTGAADPGVRLAELASGFSRHVVGSGCQADTSETLREIARQAHALTGDPCVMQDIALPAQCEAFDVRGGVQTKLADCPSSSGDCFWLSMNPACPGQHLQLTVTRSAPAPAGTETSLRCRL